jgi:hypothetical protein
VIGPGPQRRTSRCSRRGRHYGFPRFNVLAGGPAAELGRSAASGRHRMGRRCVSRRVGRWCVLPPRGAVVRAAGGPGRGPGAGLKPRPEGRSPQHWTPNQALQQTRGHVRFPGFEGSSAPGLLSLVVGRTTSW